MKSVALTIAGSDSGGGAGIQADLKTFAALGVYGTSAITAVTAQNTVRVAKADFISAETVYAQIESVVEDFEIAAVKTGMLGNAEIIESVVRAARNFAFARLVVDTVMVSKSNHRLLLEDAEAALRKLLIPCAYLITPNLPEAEMLLKKPVADLEAMRFAVKELQALGARHVLLKGGHLFGKMAIDVFYDGAEMHLLEAERVETNSTHGTGCTLSAAITAYLAQGLPVLDACRTAKEYLTGALKHAVPYGNGHGPVNHFWRSPAAPV